jgi:hypothetical protein
LTDMARCRMDSFLGDCSMGHLIEGRKVDVDLVRLCTPRALILSLLVNLELS